MPTHHVPEPHAGGEGDMAEEKAKSDAVHRGKPKLPVSSSHDRIVSSPGRKERQRDNLKLSQ